jgi:uncharacterized protein YndB with AHSA1/START domain
VAAIVLPQGPWGPEGVSCIAAEVDLRVGGRYRIANKFPDGRVFWIVGELQIIEPHIALPTHGSSKGRSNWIITDADRPRLKTVLTTGMPQATSRFRPGTGPIICGCS